MSEDLIRRLFEKLTLALGGIFYLHQVPDDVIDGTMRALDALFDRTLQELRQDGGSGGEPSSHKGPRPHPAVASLLRKIRADRER